MQKTITFGSSVEPKFILNDCKSMIISESAYQVETYTGRKRYAATNDPVFITLHGSKGTSPEMRLTNSKKKFTFGSGK